MGVLITPAMVGQVVISGLLAGSIYAMVALELGLIFGVMRVLNVALGPLMMLGACTTFWLFHRLASIRTSRSWSRCRCSSRSGSCSSASWSAGPWTRPALLAPADLRGGDRARERGPAHVHLRSALGGVPNRVLPARPLRSRSPGSPRAPSPSRSPWPRSCSCEPRGSARRPARSPRAARSPRLRDRRAALPPARLRPRPGPRRRRRLPGGRDGHQPDGPGLHVQVVPGHRAGRHGQLSGAFLGASCSGWSSSSPRCSSPRRSTRRRLCPSGAGAADPAHRFAERPRVRRWFLTSPRRWCSPVALPARRHRLRVAGGAPALHVVRADPVLEPDLGLPGYVSFGHMAFFGTAPSPRASWSRRGSGVAGGLPGRRGGGGRGGAYHRLAVPAAQGADFGSPCWGSTRSCGGRRRTTRA